jgi:glycosyltransferase involved in cell wall biosynthesis
MTAACPRPVQVIFGGIGGRRSFLEDLARELGITDRVRFLGEITRAEMIALYAHATAVFFGPLDEDYGYVTLEAMLSSKPVITCTDSGGPLEFVVDGETGLICAPTADGVAEALVRIVDHPDQSAAMGRAGRARYEDMQIGWQPVVDALLDGALSGNTARAA